MERYREVDLREPDDASLFRQEAIEARNRRIVPQHGTAGPWVVPRWILRVHWLLVALAAGALAAAWCVKVDEYATAPATVRLEQGAEEAAHCVVEGQFSGIRPAQVGPGSAAVFRPSGIRAPAREITLDSSSVRWIDATRFSIEAPLAHCSASTASGEGSYGIPGTLKVVVGSQPVLTLFPGLRRALGRDREP